MATPPAAMTMLAPSTRSLLWTYTTSAVAVLAIGCEDTPKPAVLPTPPTPIVHFKIKTLIDRLRDADPTVREDADRQLMAMAGAGFAPKDSARLLLAAAEPAAKGLEGVPPKLLKAASVNPSPDAVPFVEELFPRYPRPAKFQALNLLATLKGRPAAETYLRLLAKAPDLDSLPIGTLATEPRHADVIFPKLLDDLGKPKLLPGICQVAAAYAEEGLLTTEALRPYAETLAGLLAAKVELLEGRELYQTEAAVEESWRGIACVLLDLLAHEPTPHVVEVTRRAFGVDDPKVKAHALVALLKQGEMIGVDEAERVASHASVRLWLRGQLQDLDRFDLYPERFRNQESTAEAELAAWLASPGVLGHEVEAIECAGNQTIWTAQGAARLFYIFKFRVPRSDPRSRKGWMAAWISYPPNVQPQPATGGLCGTNFISWLDLSPEGHIARAAKATATTSTAIEDDEDN